MNKPTTFQPNLDPNKGGSIISASFFYEDEALPGADERPQSQYEQPAYLCERCNGTGFMQVLGEKKPCTFGAKRVAPNGKKLACYQLA